MIIHVGDLKYEWVDSWAKNPKTDGHSHHGLVVSKTGDIITAHNTVPEILIFDQDGNLKKSFLVPVIENHGLSLSEENGKEFIWITDTGNKGSNSRPAQVLKSDMDGNILLKITKKDLNIPDTEKFVPTCTAIEPGTGNIWITDGYGSNRIFCLNTKKEVLFKIDGSEGAAGKFACPHWIYFDTRKKDVELYVADRANDRVQVYSTKGKFLRCIDKGLTTPSVFAIFDNYMVIGELKARLVVLDINDKIIGTIGEGLQHVTKEGWPNRVVEGKKIAPADIKIGEFNSPHGMSVDKKGNIYVSEWLLGDRFTKLLRIA